MRLLTLAVGLDLRAFLEVLMDDPALLRAHLVQLDRPAVRQRLLRRPIRAGGQRLPPPLAVAGGVDRHALALADPAKGRLVAEELESVNRLAAPADQEAVVVVPDHLGLDRRFTLLDLHLTLEVKLVEDAGEQQAHALRRLGWPIPVHGPRAYFR